VNRRRKTTVTESGIDDDQVREDAFCVSQKPDGIGDRTNSLSFLKRGQQPQDVAGQFPRLHRDKNAQTAIQSVSFQGSMGMSHSIHLEEWAIQSYVCRTCQES
jgi:hypothetical protein